MTGFLTTHVLDTARGVPANGLRVDLSRVTDAGKDLVRTLVTNADGRTDTPILPTDEFAQGAYELLFHVDDYLAQVGHSGPTFLTKVPICFEMSEDAHYHVPLLLSPYGYSTYRGS